ncbi:hypothetical protein BDW71DRAFT_12981 [Aspergillus fruticulosus]
MITARAALKSSLALASRWHAQQLVQDVGKSCTKHHPAFSAPSHPGHHRFSLVVRVSACLSDQPAAVAMSSQVVRKAVLFKLPSAAHGAVTGGSSLDACVVYNRRCQTR